MGDPEALGKKSRFSRGATQASGFLVGNRRVWNANKNYKDGTNSS